MSTSINRNINFDEKRLDNKVFENITFIKCSFEKSYLANCTFIDYYKLQFCEK